MILTPIYVSLLILINSEDYHPIKCNVTEYSFTFIHTGQEPLVHGLWPEKCSECIECGYPTCCNMVKFANFTIPTETQFIDRYWFGGQSPHPGNVCDLSTSTLFEHEVLKHGSCMGMFSTDYLNLVEYLFHKYYEYIHTVCQSKKECSFYLNGDFSLK